MHEKHKLFTGKSRTVTGSKKTNGRMSLVPNLEAIRKLFCRQSAGLEVLIKVAQKQIDGKESGLGRE